MDQDELIEGLRGCLSKKANPKDWQKIKELFSHWPDDELPDVVVDYLRSTALEGPWKTYFPSKGYRNAERLRQAPKVERTINGIHGLVLASAKASLAKLEEGIKTQGKGAGSPVASIRIREEAISFTANEETSFRSSFLKAQDKWVNNCYLERFVVVVLKNGMEIASDWDSTMVSISLKNKAFVSDVQLFEEEYYSWAENGFDPDWQNMFYDEYYEDGYE